MAIGIDITAIERFRLMKDLDRFAKRVLSDREMHYWQSNGSRPETIAGFFAAKEAVGKALGQGNLLGFKNICIDHHESGQPFILLYHQAKDLAHKLGYGYFDVSISHDGAYAVAVAKGEKMNIIQERYVEELAQRLLRRDPSGHKGHYGRVGLIGGMSDMTGAIGMAAISAARTGSGVVHAIVPKKSQVLVAAQAQEIITHGIEDEGTGRFIEAGLEDILPVIQDLDALAIGTGMGRGPEVRAVVAGIIDHYKKPIVLDADALNVLAGNLDIISKKHQPLVITPHEMEMARLTGQDVKDVHNDRVKCAGDFAQEHKVIVLLKGRDSIITEDDLMYFINPTGNPGMATGGSGDILTGMICSFLGQGYDPLIATRLGAYIHGLAGDLAAEKIGQDGMIASDIIAQVPLVLKLLQEENKRRVY